MTFLSTLGAIAGMGAGILSHLVLAVFILAGSANSSPSQAQRLRVQLVLLAVMALAGVIAGFIAMAYEKPWYACSIGGCMVLVAMAIFTFTLLTSQA